MIEYLGWAATAVFVSSYFSARAETLKRIQMLGALMWMAYGFVIGALPVVVANVLVFAAAAWSGARAVADAPTTLPSDARPCCLPSAPSPPRALPGTPS